MRRGEGTAGGRAGGETRESRGKEAGEGAGAPGWAGEAQGQEDRQGHSLRVRIYLEDWGGGSFIHAFIHSFLVPGEETWCGCHELGFTFQLCCLLTSSVALGKIPNLPCVNWACVWNGVTQFPHLQNGPHSKMD